MAVVGVLGALVTIAATGFGLFFELVPDARPEKESQADLAMVSVAVDEIERINAETGMADDPSNAPRGKTTVDAPVIDVLLHNSGDSMAYITKISLRFRAAVSLMRCLQVGGGETTYVPYGINVPPDTVAGDTVSRPVRYHVEPGKDGRITLSIGQKDRTEPWLYEFDVVLQQGDGGPEITIPNVAITNSNADWETYVLTQVNESMGQAGGRPEGEHSRCDRTLADDVEEIQKHATHSAPEFSKSLFPDELREILEFHGHGGP
ncbi:hypothetical protein [Streptomyces umbrinus]|uniref:hypothetical protein n=1 Tax=Streptomyces umbrinus TaxID=67370 RepID=UPI00167AE7D9|nr:hypothetical protein [Streptomyces umbrinus]